MAFTGNYACNVFKSGLPSGIFNLATGTSQVFKIALYNNTATLNADTTAYTSSGEVSASGYTAGGAVLNVSVRPVVVSGETTAYFSFYNVLWSAAMTARGALIYLANGTTNPAVCVLDFGNDKTSRTTFTVAFPEASSTSAIIRIA